jgi:hypothetical protein
MTRALAFLLLALVSFPAFAADDASAPKGMVMPTVGGFVGKTNRGPFDPKLDSLLAKLDVTFKNAFAFDREMLEALPQGTVTAKPIEFEKRRPSRAASA